MLYPWLYVEVQRNPAIFCHFENILIKRFDFYEHVSTISNRYNLQPFHLLWNYESDLNLQFTK
jgi:hypothetical protein